MYPMTCRCVRARRCFKHAQPPTATSAGEANPDPVTVMVNGNFVLQSDGIVNAGQSEDGESDFVDGQPDDDEIPVM